MSELQDIFKMHGEEYLQTRRFSKEQQKVFAAIQACRTSALGGHVETCDHCGNERIAYNSCRNRHCPKCQSVAKEEWIQKQSQSLLNIGYFHVVFTVPSELNPIFLHNKEALYGLLFRAASETLLELCSDKKYLGATPGFTAVLHTWSQDLSFHPHLHVIVTSGGLTDLGEWHHSRKSFFIPIRVLSRKFRGKFLYFLRRMQWQLAYRGFCADLRHSVLFGDFISSLYAKDWVTYCKPPFGSPSKVLEYIGRYTHRVAISNDRIKDVSGGKVTFSWRDYKAGNKIKKMVLPAVEFIRRFMLHVLPHGFRRIRHYGLLSPRNKAAKIKLCKRLTNTPVTSNEQKLSKLEMIKRIFGDDFNLCPVCKMGHMTRDSPRTITPTA